MTDATSVIVDLLARGHAVQFRAHGDSMHPVIREDDVLHVEPSKQIERGDVVLVLAPRGLTAHRVIARRGAQLVTRGDNAPAPDDAIDESQVLGKVTYVMRDGHRRTVSRNAMVFVRRLVRRFAAR
jgi:phage repressor protein C with HTH and peptisase S24 domain